MMLFAQADTEANSATKAASNWTANIRDSLWQSVTGLWDSALELVPNLAAMLVILIIGWIIARVLRWIAATVFKRVKLDAICDRLGLHEMTRSVGIAIPFSQILAQLAFWSVMLLFLTAAVDVLGMASISRAIEALVGYLPNVIGAMIIGTVGLVLANVARKVVTGAADRFGIEYAGAVGQVVFGMIALVVGSLAVGQLNLNTALVDRVIEIFLMATGAALAISIGFGSRDMAKQIVAGVYARDSFPEGASVSIGDDEGTVAAVRAVNTSIRTDSGKLIVIPNAQLMEMKVEQSE